jgi:hypothetical protein
VGRDGVDVANGAGGKLASSDPLWRESKYVVQIVDAPASKP